jgi:hypothetical protein
MNILITPCSADTVLIELARCMALMKNLYTVQISSSTSIICLSRRRCIQISALYKAAFAGYRFPSVRHIAFNSLQEFELLPCFPEARQVYMSLGNRPAGFEWYWKDYVLERVKKLASHCPKVQVFTWDDEHRRSWGIASGKSHLRPYDSTATGIRDTRHTAEPLPSTDIHRT